MAGIPHKRRQRPFNAEQSPSPNFSALSDGFTERVWNVPRCYLQQVLTYSAFLPFTACLCYSRGTSLPSRPGQGLRQDCGVHQNPGRPAPVRSPPFPQPHPQAPRGPDCEQTHIHSGCSYGHWALQGLTWDLHLERQESACLYSPSGILGPLTWIERV